jgi:hypothetical protein
MNSWRAVALALCLVVAASAWATGPVVIEDWSQQAVGAKGVPKGWEPQRWGSPSYDFTIAQDGGMKVLHMKSNGDGSTIARSLKGKIKLQDTPILEWRWKAVVLPKGGDSRNAATDDQAAQIYVGWERFPREIRSQLIGYVWDTSAPVGTIVKSGKTGTVTYVVVRSGPAELGTWHTERRNVAEDYRKVYGSAPESPDLLSVSIDSNDTKSSSESYMGSIVFTR